MAGRRPPGCLGQQLHQTKPRTDATNIDRSHFKCVTDVHKSSLQKGKNLIGRGCHWGTNSSAVNIGAHLTDFRIDATKLTIMAEGLLQTPPTVINLKSFHKEKTEEVKHKTNVQVPFQNMDYAPQVMTAFHPCSAGPCLNHMVQLVVKNKHLSMM